MQQTTGWVIAALAAVLAAVLVGLERKPRAPWVAAKQLARGAVCDARLVDGVVAATLIGWWVLAPVHLDDGWVMARQSGFSTSGGFSNYYDSLGTNLPNGYWLEWLQHWLTQSSPSLLLLRVPALVCLAATWVLCRWIFARVLASSGGQDRLGVWALASTFLAGALAWGMTLRPEPTTALLITGVMACTVHFIERGTTAPLAFAAILAPLAITAHHAGLIVIAPLLVVAPRLMRWARTLPIAAATIAITAIALTVALAFVGSDIQQRSADAQLLGSYAVNSWFDEFRRYSYLSEVYTGTPLRRGSFALIALALAAFLLRARRDKRVLVDFATSALAVALLLMLAVPSKWAWHFGALMGIASLAVASETVRLRREGERSRVRQARPFIAVGAAVVAIAWAWGPRKQWAFLDLRTLSWTPGFEDRLSLTLLATALPLLLLSGVGVARVARRGRPSRQAPWHIARATAPLIVVPLIVFTGGVIVADTVSSSSWTLVRQNLETLQGGSGCGLGDDLVLVAPSTIRPLARSAGMTSRVVPTWVPNSPVPGAPRFALGPAGAGSASSPWFDVSRTQRVGVFVAGVPGAGDRLKLEWGRFDGGHAEVVRADRVAVSPSSNIPGMSPWRFFTAPLALRKPRATVVRSTLRSDVAPGGSIAVTAPVTYASERFTQRVKTAGTKTLVNPYLRTYFPCADQPKLSNGIVEVPRFIVVPTEFAWPVAWTTSPFFGLLDVYQTERLAFTDPKNPDEELTIFEVHEGIMDARIVPPVASTTTT